VWLVLMAALIGLEVAPRISDSAAAWLTPQDRLGDILRLFERHPTLMWRLKPGLDTEFQTAPMRINDLALRGEELPGPRSDGGVRVLCMGESLCFGWGVDLQHSYSKQLEGLLGRRLDPPVEVINAGTPGYTSHQGLTFLQDVGFDLQPDLVTLPYVINDIDRLRFFANDGRPDSEQQPASRLWIGLNNLSAGSVTFGLYRRGLLWCLRRAVGPRAEARALGLGMQCRVPPQDYEANLRELVAACRERDIDVLFVVQPLHLPLPEIHGAPAPIQPTLTALYHGTHDLDPAAAAAAADHSVAQLQASLDAAIEGPDDQVRQHIDQSREWDAYRCRAQAIRYNGIMRRLAAELGVPLADVTAAVAARPDEHLYRDEHDDPIHPNEAGHRLYAEVMGEVFVRATRGVQEPPAPGSPAPAAPR
jgi:lysophospholipase L1-like esterase